MADDYKEKLRKFIADIPLSSNQIVSGEQRLLPFSAEFKEQLANPNFSLPTNPLFLKYTGASHTGLLRNWNGGGIRTTCNEFVGKCGIEMGAKQFLGQFELEALLRNSGKGHAWIPANSGKRPGYGDIFRPVKFHMAVSLGFEGDVWHTAESGQGGPKSGFDSITRYQKKFEPSLLPGWCDIKLYLDPRPPIPDWLVGMWVIYCGNETYNYQINEYYEASYFSWKPIGNPANSTPIDTGTVAFQGSDDFTITWSKEGGTEKFKYNRFESFPKIMEKVTGVSNRNEPLKGIRL